MRTEFSAMWRKETLILLSGFGGQKRWTRCLAAVTLFAGGLVLPLMIGEYWLQNAAFLVVFPILGGVVVTQTVIDAVAGERERKTLETLLSTPVEGVVVVLGKVLPPVALAAAISLGNLVTGVITVNIVAWNGSVQWPASYLIVGLPFLSVLFPLVMVSAAFLGSMRASSTRQAAQVFTLIVTGLLLVPPVTWVLLPDTLTRSWAGLWAGLDAPMMMTWTLMVLGMVCGVLLLVAVSGFQRQRLTR